MAKSQQAPVEKKPEPRQAETTVEKKAPAVKKAKVSRREAANKVVADLTGKTTLTELAKKVNGMVTASGGPDNLKESAFVVRQALQAAEQFGLVALTRPTDLYVEKVK